MVAISYCLHYYYCYHYYYYYYYYTMFVVFTVTGSLSNVEAASASRAARRRPRTRGGGRPIAGRSRLNTEATLNILIINHEDLG